MAEEPVRRRPGRLTGLRKSTAAGSGTGRRLMHLSAAKRKGGSMMHHNTDSPSTGELHRLGCPCGCMSVPPWAFDPECAAERLITTRWSDCAACGVLDFTDLREATRRGLSCTAAFCVAELLWSERGWVA